MCPISSDKRLQVTTSSLPLPIVPPCTEAEERPVYRDDNISVFALPVVPSETPLQLASPEAAGTLKRKREDSPERSSKRFLNQHGTDQLAGDITAATEFLRKAAYASDFDPASLNEEIAQAWRQLLIQSMFPASQVLSEAPDQNGPESEGARCQHKDRCIVDSCTKSFPTGV
jgi:ribonuclease Z